MSGFEWGNVDPFLYAKKSKKVVYIALYVDYNLVVGDIEAIDDVITTLKK